jgi:hypothetical protein
MQRNNGNTHGTLGQGRAALENQQMTNTNTLWRCVQWRAGKMLSNVLFNTRKEAEAFVAQMHRAEPDIFWRMEPVEARLVWN